MHTEVNGCGEEILVEGATPLPEDLPRESFLDEFDAILQGVSPIAWRKSFVDYVRYQGNPGFGCFCRIAEAYVASSAKETRDPDWVVQELTIKYEMDPKWQVCKRIASNRVPVLMVIADINANLDFVVKDMDIAGYFLGFKRKISMMGNPFLELQFEPMFEVEQSDEIRKYPYAYHWTPMYNFEKIKNSGLQINSDNHMFDTPNRIYLLSGKSSMEVVNRLGLALCGVNKDPRNNGEYVLLIIDTEEIPLDCKFYGDPNMEGAYYTETDIPASAILQHKIRRLKF